jgi:hypothetical protein
MSTPTLVEPLVSLDVISALANKADKSNVLELDNTTPFTPTADNHPATKAYVDENAGGGGVASTQQANPPGMARMVSVRAAGGFGIQAASTTGYMAVRSWDGAVTIFGNGEVFNQHTYNLAIPTSGAWSKSAPKEIYVWSCTGGNATQSGNLTVLTTYDGTTSFDISGLSSLYYVEVNYSKLTSLDLSGLSSLQTLYLYDSGNLPNLDCSGLTSLEYLVATDSNLTSFDGSGLTSLRYLILSGNNLTSVLLPDFSGTQPYTWTTYALDLSDNNLSTDAVWLLLDSLPVAVTQPYPINLVGNPCDDTVTAGPNLVAGATYSQAQVEALLTAKGYELQLSGGTLTM